MNGDVVDVEAVAPFALRVQFADGAAGKVRFGPSHLTGVFAALKAPVVFAQAHIEEGRELAGRSGPCAGCDDPGDQEPR